MSTFIQNIVPFDQNTIEVSLKEYFKSLESFKDINFEGSKISSIIKLLAYDTSINSFFANNIGNEMFISTATNPKNIYRLADSLNYLPLRKTAATLRVQLDTTELTEQEYNSFNPYINFSYGGENLILFKTDLLDQEDNLRKEVFEVDLYEGVWTTKQFISTGDSYETFILEDDGSIDNNFLNVNILNTDLTIKTILTQMDGRYPIVRWTPRTEQQEEDNIITERIKNTDLFRLRKLENLILQFDDGTFTYPLQLNDIIEASYLKTKGAEVNFNSGTLELIDDIELSFQVGDKNYLEDGTNEESVLSVKNNAPLFYSTNSRAVTEADYVVLSKKYDKYSLFKGIQVWGGDRETIIEKLTPFTLADGEVIERWETYPTFLSLNFINLYVDTNETRVATDVGYVNITALKKDITSSSTVNKFNYIEQDDVNDIYEYFDDLKVITIRFRSKQTIPVQLLLKVELSVEPGYVWNELEFTKILQDTYINTTLGYSNRFIKSSLIKTIDDQSLTRWTDISYLVYLRPQSWFSFEQPTSELLAEDFINVGEEKINPKYVGNSIRLDATLNNIYFVSKYFDIVADVDETVDIQPGYSIKLFRSSVDTVEGVCSEVDLTTGEIKIKVDNMSDYLANDADFRNIELLEGGNVNQKFTVTTTTKQANTVIDTTGNIVLDGLNIGVVNLNFGEIGFRRDITTADEDVKAQALALEDKYALFVELENDEIFESTKETFIIFNDDLYYDIKI